MSSSKIVLLILIALIIGAWVFFDLGQYISFANLKQNQEVLQKMLQDNFLLVSIGFFVFYILVTALSLPGAAIMTLAAGAVFGFISGFLIVSFASSIGATLAFLVARFLLQDTIKNKFGDKMHTINQGIAREGAFYLFTLRLIPVIPFFVINLVFGLTRMKTWTFYWVSQLGMLAGTVVYINAGTQLASIESPKDILSAKIIASFVLLGLFPLIAKKIIDRIRRKPHAKI